MDLCLWDWYFVTNMGWGEGLDIWAHALYHGIQGQRYQGCQQPKGVCASWEHRAKGIWCSESSLGVTGPNNLKIQDNIDIDSSSIPTYRTARLSDSYGKRSWSKVFQERKHNNPWEHVNKVASPTPWGTFKWWIDLGRCGHTRPTPRSISCVAMRKESPIAAGNYLNPTL